MPAGSVRARVRAEMIEEIKITARRLLSTDGSNLSLRAVARDMGMVSSALYRYFPSRDDLLTALILDAYTALADAAEAADAKVSDRGDLHGRWLSFCHGVRQWALAAPGEYALIYGTPVPGYTAPLDTFGPATRTPRALMRILSDGVRCGALTDPGLAGLPAELRADLSHIRDANVLELPETLLADGLLAWTHLCGAISFELFGQLSNVIAAREAYFDYQVRQVANLIGL